MATPSMMMMTKVAKIQKHSATSFNMNILCLLSRLIKAHCTLQFLIVISFVPLVNGYCWQPGKNPGFNGTPKVEQVDIRTVKVSWKGITTQTECADQFLVKYWESTSPLDYHLSDPVNNDKFSTVIRVTPKVKYVFEVIAREDKGAIAGVDYNRAENVEFKTSMRNVEVTIEEDPEPIIITPTKITNPVQDSSTPILVQPSSSLEKNTDQGKNPSKESKSTSMAGLPFNIEIICIIAVCGVVAILIAIGIVYKLTCNKKSSADLEEEYEEDDEDDDDVEDEEDSMPEKQKFEV